MADHGSVHFSISWVTLVRYYPSNPNCIKVMTYLYPIPTWLLIECINEFVPIITKIVTLSLNQGEMPHELKHAPVKSLLKKLILIWSRKIIDLFKI